MAFTDIDANLLAIEYADFCEAIVHDRAPDVDGVQGLRSLALVYGFLESERAGRAVTAEELLSGAASAYQDELGGRHEGATDLGTHMNAWQDKCDFGVVHGLAFLACRAGEGPIVETLQHIVNDTTFGAVEIAPPKIRRCASRRASCWRRRSCRWCICRSCRNSSRITRSRVTMQQNESVRWI